VLAHFSLANIARSRGQDNEVEKRLNIALKLLANYRPDEIVSGSDGVIAGHFAETIRSLMNVGTMQ
jgi:hypothetical protein